MTVELQAPDFEIIVRVKSSDAAVIAGFFVGGDQYDMVVGITSPLHRQRITKLLEYAIAGLDAADWLTVDDLDLHQTLGDEGGDDAPDMTGIPF